MADIERGDNPKFLSWHAPTENVDGTPITGPLVYNLYRADNEDLISSMPSLHYSMPGTLQPEGHYRAPLEQFAPGRHVIALTAVDADGDESAFSNTLGFTITVGVDPRPPVLLDA